MKNRTLILGSLFLFFPLCTFGQFALSIGLSSIGSSTISLGSMGHGSLPTQDCSLTCDGILVDIEENTQDFLLQLDIFPNPTSNDNIRYTFKSLNNEEFRVTLINASGQVMYTGVKSPSSDASYSINLQKNIADGIYFLLIQQGNSLVSKKIGLLR